MSCILQSRAFHRNHFLAELINKLRKNKDSFDQMTVTVTCAFSISFFLGLQLFFFSFQFFLRILFRRTKKCREAACSNGFYNTIRCMCITGTANAINKAEWREWEKKNMRAEDFMGIVFIWRECVFIFCLNRECCARFDALDVRLQQQAIKA